MAMWADRLLDNGFSEADVRRMVRDNAAQLLGAQSRATAGAASA
jgi:hypothetical protein